MASNTKVLQKVENAEKRIQASVLVTIFLPNHEPTMLKKSALWVIVSFFLFQLVIVNSIQAQTTKPNSKDLEQSIDKIVKKEMGQQKIVGLAIGVIQNGKITLSKGYGFRNLEKNLKVDTKTVFNLASNSKPIMAIAAMQLVEKGMLDLDEPVSNYVQGVPSKWEKVTTRHLLCHQSGIPHYSNGPVIPSAWSVLSKDETDPSVGIHRFLNSPLIYSPGERNTYSSYAYLLLSAVVQSAGKKPIIQQLNERIIKPLSLTSVELDVPFEDQKNWATAYRIRGESHKKVLDQAHFWKHGAGGYKLNIVDFGKFALALCEKKLINTETTRQMWTIQKTNDGKTTSYGLGVQVSGKGPTLKVSHGGSQDETRTQMTIFPNKKLGVVVLSNTQKSNPRKIAEAILKELNPKKEK